MRRLWLLLLFEDTDGRRDAYCVFFLPTPPYGPRNAHTGRGWKSPLQRNQFTSPRVAWRHDGAQFWWASDVAFCVFGPAGGDMLDKVLVTFGWENLRFLFGWWRWRRVLYSSKWNTRVGWRNHVKTPFQVRMLEFQDSKHVVNEALRPEGGTPIRTLSWPSSCDDAIDVSW